jgi:hypothetical protein
MMCASPQWRGYGCPVHQHVDMSKTIQQIFMKFYIVNLHQTLINVFYFNLPVMYEAQIKLYHFNNDEPKLQKVRELLH